MNTNYIKVNNDNDALLNYQAKNEESVICNEFINALELCLKSDKKSSSVNFTQLNIFDSFNLKRCLDNDSKVKFDHTKFNVKFEYYFKEDFFQYKSILFSNILLSNKTRHIKLVKNSDYNQEIKNESEYIFTVGTN